MISVNTNDAAAQALLAMSSASTQVDKSQQATSTGMRVAGAKDDGATYAIAQGMRSRSLDIETVMGSLRRAQSILDVAYASAASILDILDQMRSRALSLSDPSTDAASRAALASDLSDLVKQLDDQARTASFGGVNLLVPVTDPPRSLAVPGGGPNPSLAFSVPMDGRPALLQLGYSFYNVTPTVPNEPELSVSGTETPADLTYGVSSRRGATTAFQSAFQYGDPYDFAAANPAEVSFAFTTNPFPTLPAPAPPPDPSYGVSVTSLSVTSYRTDMRVLDTAEGGSERMVYNPMTAEWLGLTGLAGMNSDQMLSAIALATERVTSGAQDFGSQSARMGSEVDQLGRNKDVVDAGVGNLVDADLSREAAKLQAAQTRQGLAIKAMAIASAAPNMVMQLFR